MYCIHYLGNTRWWATYELYSNIKLVWNDCCSCIMTAIGDGEVGDYGARINRLKDTIQNPLTVNILKFQLAIVVITAKPLVEATYKLEGDGPCSIIAYDILNHLSIWFETYLPQMTFPGIELYISEYTQSIIQLPQFAGDFNLARQFAINEARLIVQPAYNYFNDRIFNQLAEDIALYKILRYANPFAFNRMNTSNVFSIPQFRADISSLNHFSIEQIDSMIENIPRYIILTNIENLEQVPLYDELEKSQIFWQTNRAILPAISIFIRYAYTIITSSASVERVFSILKRVFDYSQKEALEDYTFLSTMIQFNKLNK